MDQNVVSLVGRLADDPKFFANEDESKQRVWFRLCVARGGRKDANGNDLVDYIPITAFGKKAPAILHNCHKGKEVSVTGEMHEDSRPVKLSDGRELVHPETSKTLYTNYTEVVASRVSFGRDSIKTLNARAAAGDARATQALQRMHASQQQAASAGAAAPATAPIQAPASAPTYAPTPAPAPAPQTPTSNDLLVANVTQAVLSQMAASQAAQAQAPQPQAADNPLAGMVG
jgi:single-stranded DNA-binding protein